MRRDRDYRASRHRYWLDTPVWASQQASHRLRRRRRDGRLQVVTGVLASGSGGRGGAVRSSVGIDRSERLERIEDQAAAFATENLFVVVVLHEKLQRVREHAQSTAFTLAVFDLCERVTVVTLGDAVVQGEHVFRDRHDGFLSLRGRGGQFLFLRSVLHFDLFAVRGNRLFSFFQI